MHTFAIPPTCDTSAQNLYRSTSLPAMRMWPSSVRDISSPFHGDWAGSYPAGHGVPTSSGGKGFERMWTDARP